MDSMIKLLHEIGKLKDLKRAGWGLRKVPNPESVADHSFRLSTMALILAEKAGLDKNKCVQMAIVHDLAESIVGDITPYDGVSKEEKSILEKNAMILLLKDIHDKEILDLWTEYNQKKTLEAKFVNQLDKMETLLQAFEYQKKYVKEGVDLSEFWISVKKQITHPILLEMFEKLKK